MNKIKKIKNEIQIILNMSCMIYYNNVSYEYEFYRN